MQRIIEPALAKANMSKTELGRKMGVTVRESREGNLLWMSYVK